jgi:hypothetical protein
MNTPQLAEDGVQAEQVLAKAKQDYERTMAKACPKNRPNIFKSHLAYICPNFLDIKSACRRAQVYVGWVYANPVLGSEIPTPEVEWVIHGFGSKHCLEAAEVKYVAKKLPSWTRTMFMRLRIPARTSAYNACVLIGRSVEERLAMCESTGQRLKSGLETFNKKVAIVGQQLTEEKLNKGEQMRFDGLLDMQKQSTKLLRATTSAEDGSTSIVVGR